MENIITLDRAATAKAITLTRIIETSVFGTTAYHFECDCGETSKRWDREATAVKHAKAHASQHGEDV